MVRKLMLMSMLGMLMSCAMHAGDGALQPEVIAIDSEQLVQAHVVVVRDLPDDVVSTKSLLPQIQPYMPIPSDLPVDPAYVDRMPEIDEPEITRAPLQPAPSPAASFQALDDSMRTIPPDTQGSVGANHVLTMLNDRVRIQSKTGTILKTVTLSTFWGTARPFDPRVTYDPYNKRWIASVSTDSRSTNAQIGLAVSQTSDPLGAWNIFFVKSDSTGATWSDFPNLGFNNKWIAIQANMFTVSGSSFSLSKVFVFDKAQAYAGTSTVKIISLSGLGAGQAPAITYDNVQPDLYLLQNWSGNSGGNGLLRLYKLTGALGSETITPVAFAQKPGQIWQSTGGSGPQLGTSVRIDAGGARIVAPVVRYNSIWAAHTVFLPWSAPTHTAVQWWQISLAGVVQQFGRIEDTTATANTGTHYGFPTISVNVRNDALIGYTQFSPTTYASAGYSFRLGNDPLHVMRESKVLKAGLATYTKTFGGSEVRWGDYSATTTDPNGYDLWTIQEYADTHASDGQSRWATWWGRIAPLTACTCS